MSNLAFNKCKNKNDLRDVYRYDADAFAETSDFEWSIASLEKEQAEGWDIYSVSVDSEIIAACFLKNDGKTLHTKNTSVKISYQGQGVSHLIKEFYEKCAREQKAKEIINYCAVDNFRNIALNESHGYSKLPGDKNSEIVLWKKKI
jgi:predicted GNAT family acetyltransferase